MAAAAAIAPAFAKIDDEITPAKIARDTGLNESQVAAWVTHAQSYADASGYRVFFRVETPPEVLELVPRITPAFMLIVLAT